MKKTKVNFTLSAEIVGDATGGILLGEFNDWNLEQGIELKKKKDGSLSTSLSLEAGRSYQYRYKLNDRRWVNDCNVDTAIHPENCVIHVVIPAYDDLTKIDGIGKKIAELLIAENITTFAILANTPLKTLKKILESAGSRYKSYDPSSWSEQAKLAINGKAKKEAKKTKKQLSIDEL